MEGAIRQQSHEIRLGVGPGITAWNGRLPCKYRPDYPVGGFESLPKARDWVLAFVHWYNTAHRHSAIRFLTPQQRHSGQDRAILQRRHRLYQQAKARHPRRWSGATRDWTPIGAVTLNASAPAAVPLEQAP